MENNRVHSINSDSCKQEDRLVSEYPVLDTQKVRTAFAEQKNIPRILGPVASLNTVIDTPGLSVARLADGELRLMTGIGSPNQNYQRVQSGLSVWLNKVMSLDKKPCRIALPKWFIYDIPLAATHMRFLNREFIPDAFRGDYFRHFSSNYEYLDACMSVPYMHYGCLGNDFVSGYYSKVIGWLRGKRILLVTGDRRYGKFDHQLMADADVDLSVLFVPPANAWDSHVIVRDSILRTNCDCDRLVLLCCGPLASVLAYELSDRMQCVDIGHMLGDYNLAMGGRCIGNFWR